MPAQVFSSSFDYGSTLQGIVHRSVLRNHFQQPSVQLQGDVKQAKQANLKLGKKSEFGNIQFISNVSSRNLYFPNIIDKQALTAFFFK